MTDDLYRLPGSAQGAIKHLNLNASATGNWEAWKTIRTEMLRLARENAELRESIHHANGVADLAMRHRDFAEAELAKLRARIEGAPVAIMDTRVALSICAPNEEDFPALYALQGKRVRLLVEDGE